MCLIVGVMVLAILFAVYFVVAVIKTTIALLLLLPWLVIGLIAGWLASLITQSRHGLLADIGIGLAGSVIGGVLYVVLTHHSEGGPLSLTRLVVATAGSIILLLIVKAINETVRV
ncbi:MAG TPA: GlsB/YeaQ/YmgE family stress response membrane protein [Chloroflexota bacterium]|nr:GlsB/YeaQ/YmgE family stress response membrane protein [Chloroflexota bacterium]